LRHRSIRIGIEVVVAALALSSVAAARAPEASTAREAFDEAERLYQLGRFEEAITSYEKAYALDPQPAFLYNIALAHRRQYEIDDKPEHLRRARELYRNYLRLEPNTPLRAAIEKIIEDLGAKLKEEPAPPPPAPPPKLKARPEPPPPGLVSAPSTERGRSSSTGWWIAGGVAVAAAVVAVVLVASMGGTAKDGPTINLGGMPRQP
jgi:tetratricopeptide (TPR) repeat protein